MVRIISATAAGMDGGKVAGVLSGRAASAAFSAISLARARASFGVGVVELPLQPVSPGWENGIEVLPSRSISCCGLESDWGKDVR